MKLTESQLRGLIKQALIEASEGPAVLKNASTNVVAAINEDDPAAFWGSVEGVIEGLQPPGTGITPTTPEESSMKLTQKQLRSLIQEIAGFVPAKLKVGDELINAQGDKVWIVEIWLNLWSGKARPYVKYEYELANGVQGTEENSVDTFLDMIKDFRSAS